MTFEHHDQPARANDPEAARARARARARRTTSTLRRVLAAHALFVAATFVFLAKIRGGIIWDGAFGLMVHAQLAASAFLIAVNIFARRLADGQPRNAATLAASFETLALLALLPLATLAWAFPALLVVAGLRFLLSVFLWGLVLRAKGDEHWLEQTSAAHVPRRAPAPDALRVTHAAERRSELARIHRWRTALRVATIGVPIAALAAFGLWLGSPTRAFHGAAEEFVERWNTDVVSVSELLASDEARAEWSETVERLGWRRSRPFLEDRWKTEAREDEYVRTAHASVNGSEIESWWTHDGDWRLIGIVVPLEGVLEHFRARWNAHDVAALPWFFARQERAARVIERLIDTREWGATLPSLGPPVEVEARRGRQAFELPLDGGRLSMTWRFTGGRWRIVDFRPPHP
ncbi:MAG: hypothetical protein WD226_09455 [Planctomycetota bacterium]